MEKRGFWKTIYEYSKKYQRNLVTAVLFSLLTGIAVAVQPLIIKYIVDDGIQNTAVEPDMRIKIAVFYCLIYVGVCIFRMSMWAIGYRNMLQGLEGFLFRIRSEFFDHIQTLCMRFYDHTSSGELFNYIMGSPTANLKNFLQQFSMNVPYQTVALVISLSAMLSYDWLLTIVMLLIVIVSILLNHHSRKKIKKLSGDLLQSESEASKYIGDVLHGSRAIKMYAIEDDIYTNFEKYMSTLKNKGVSLSFTQWVENAKPEFTQNFGTALIYFVGAFSCIYRGLTVGELVAFVSSMGIILNSLNLWFNVNLIRSNAEAGLERITTVLNIQTTTPEKTEHLRDIEIEKEKAKRNQTPCIAFHDVSFGYDNRKILEHFNCKMEYNHSYGLVGASGSGKSTITKLIMRLYEVESGEIKIHNRNIKDFSLHDLRKSIGIVPQDPFMFQGSIIENIRIACPQAGMLEIMKAMETARVHEFVNELPNGWNTIVGEDGYGISGGQKQRIAIARAILGKPDILIFDEATSALDNVSEKYIQSAMEELMKTHTVIMIAHRLTTVKNVDEIFVFDQGKIVQRGNFNELSQREGLFQDMLNMNAEDE
ncbi:ABC transporter ATP-binding protein [Ructibacterium gallinarum]|uniref:ABC transporter ATP-binding protein n=1 Tax=Ructibacterium gallinarum TaxID=2779355 RepID=A0A9D5M2F3_9FIRM|nr:ABC transporter ATP-binding protein [Ructibacterium gallinarum]MBE5040896.1 ABC transporter ATP-binding protein [Ructibacterium gallinarum]